MRLDAPRSRAADAPAAACGPAWSVRRDRWWRTADAANGAAELRLARFEFFERELQLRDLRVQLFRGAAELHALQSQQLDLQLLDQDIA